MARAVDQDIADGRTRIARPAGTSTARSTLRHVQHPGGTYALELEQAQEYRVVVRAGAIGDLADLVRAALRSWDTDDYVILTDHGIPASLVNGAVMALSSLGPTRLVTIAPGERSKSLATAVDLLGEFNRLGVARRTAIVALGGGVVCDLAGFVSSLYMRGVPYVCVPTSLVGQVDAAIGGKVGVDAFGAKNITGAFYHPVLVVVDPELLRSLPHAEFVNGLAEVIKVGVIASPSLIYRVEGLDRSAPERSRGIDGIVAEAIDTKLRLLVDDPTEVSTLDRALNFGHCVGHSLEAVSEFSHYRHGEAVAVGMAFASVLGATRGVCSPEAADGLLRLLASFGLPIVMPPGMDAAVWEHLSVIRRIRNGSLRVVVPTRIGDVTVLRDIERSEYLAVVQRMSLLRWRERRRGTRASAT